MLWYIEVFHRLFSLEMRNLTFEKQGKKDIFVTYARFEFTTFSKSKRRL